MHLYCPSCERKTEHTVISVAPTNPKTISPWSAMTLGMTKVMCRRCGKVSAKT